MSTALYAGSFDPITHGHIDVITRVAARFKRVIVGVGFNPAKKYIFSVQERMEYVKRFCKHLNNIDVIAIPSDRLTADIAYEQDAVLVKGVRNMADFDYERMLHDISIAHQHVLDTFIVPSQPQLSHISSSAAKEVCKLNGNTQDFIPVEIKEEMEKRLNNQLMIGVTGSIATGKSTLTKALVEHFNQDIRAHDIDLDLIAKDILFNRTETSYVALRKRLQRIFWIRDDKWSPKALGSVLFNDPEKLEILNEEMKVPLLTRIRAEVHGKQGIILINAALLVEFKFLHLVNGNIIITDTDEQTQMSRLLSRGHTAEQARRRIDSQFNIDKKLHGYRSYQISYGNGSCELVRTDKDLPQNLAKIVADKFILPKYNNVN